MVSICTYLGTFCLQDRAIDHHEKRRHWKDRLRWRANGSDDEGFGVDDTFFNVHFVRRSFDVLMPNFDVFFSFLTLFSVTMSFGIFDAWTRCFDCFFEDVNCCFHLQLGTSMSLINSDVYLCGFNCVTNSPGIFR